MLTNEMLQTFLRDGFVTVRIGNGEVPENTHEKIAIRAKEFFKHGRNGPQGSNNPNDDVDKHIPELADVWASPTVDGALRSLLGEVLATRAQGSAARCPYEEGSGTSTFES